MKISEMTPEQIEKKRASQRTEEYKAKRRERYKLPGVKERERTRIRRYNKTPEAKVRKKEYKKEYIKKYPEKYKEKKKIQKKRRYQRNEEYILNYKKKNKYCSNCSWNEHLEILQFHHIKDKLENISQLKKKSLDKIKKEIEKCILLCPNCHFWLHYIDSKRRKKNKSLLNTEK